MLIVISFTYMHIQCLVLLLSTDCLFHILSVLTIVFKLIRFAVLVRHFGRYLYLLYSVFFSIKAVVAIILSDLLMNLSQIDEVVKFTFL